MNSSWIERLLGRPSLIYSFLVLFLFLGLMGYRSLDRKLFPDSNYPEVAVVIVEPGASAQSLAANVAVPVEEELYTLDLVRRVYSTTIDEVCVIRAEFDYAKDLDTAASDVSNALAKIRATLPPDIREPQIHKISAATAPVVVIAMSPRRGGDLAQVRQLAEQQIRRRLLRLPGVANVDVFGGYRKELQIVVDKERLDRFGLSLGRVLAVLQKDDRDRAIGFLSGDRRRWLIRAPGREESVAGLAALPLGPSVTLGDVARIHFGPYENTSGYYGNGREAIALAVQRGRRAGVIRTIEAVEAELERLRADYPGVRFQITDTQKDIIVQSTRNMFESLRDAILMSVLVVFFFLASFRQVLVVLFTIPLVYASTVALMWLVGIEFNVVTLTAIILALGLLLDDAVVVMENIERHYQEAGEDIRGAVLRGTREIMFADLSGTVTTMIALAPILFVGGYPQTIFRPLTGTLLLALGASYLISITAVPLLSLRILALRWRWLLRAEAVFARVTGAFNRAVQGFFARVVEAALERRLLAGVYLGVLGVLFVISLKVVMPLVGQELLPPMDTGGIQVRIVTDPNLPIAASRRVVEQAGRILADSGRLLRLSAAIGSEPGVLSLGSGSGLDHIAITATYVDRYQRRDSIWDIERRLRRRLARLENVRSVDVFDYGATALSSIRANLDLMISGPDFATLSAAADQVEKAMYRTRGLVSVGRTWHRDKTVYELKLDRRLAAHYGLSQEDVARQLQWVLRGVAAASFPATNSRDFAVRLWLPAAQRDRLERLQTLLIDTPKGEKIPLGAIASLGRGREPSVIYREGLDYTIEVYGYREKAAISHLMDRFAAQLARVKLPPAVETRQVGDIKEFRSAAGRMLKAIAFAVILIFLTLIVFFDSLKVSLMIIFSIPLTLIGASWTLLLLGYHVSMPAMMGFILLSGIIVNNAILLIHFAQERMAEGLDPRRAMLESIRIRTRPVLMTALAVAAGMLPVALGWAVGLERLAPLGAVAIGGLLVGTFLTLVFIPLVFIWTTRKPPAPQDRPPAEP